MGFELFEDVGRAASAAIEARAAELTTWFAGIRISPRFRTPTELAILAG